MDLYKIAASGLKGIGKKTLTKLCAKTNGLKALFEEDIISLSERCNIKKELLTNMNRNKALALAEKQLIFTKRYGIQTLFYEDSGYPALLKECTDAPITLFYKGNAPLNTRTVSIIGTRKATSYGKENVEHIISKFQGQKTIVISGLAYGIDTFVHECCLKYDIPTIGVLGHGLDMIYPRSNRDLAKRMCKNGGLLTEFGINHSISRYCFLFFSI